MADDQTRSAAPPTPPKTAWVFSGGGSLGAVQVGMMQALARAGVVPDCIVGASVGALNGAFFAQDPTPARADALADLWMSLRREDVFPLSLWTGFRALVLKRDHVVAPEALQRLLDRALQVQRFEQMKIPLHIVASDALNGEEVVLSSGDVRTALLASAAIPVVFPSVHYQGRYLVDGGVSSNTPITSAMQQGATRLIVLPTGTSCGAREPPHHMAALALHMLSLLTMRQLDRDIARYQRDVQIIIVPPLCPLNVSVFDFSHTQSLIDQAREQTQKWLADDGLAQTGALHVPLAHSHQPHDPDHACGLPAVD